ncbi:hypothetical protein RQP46_007248 [Phenoliferia psychrophenolica]
MLGVPSLPVDTAPQSCHPINSPDGNLSYSFNPTSATRDSIPVATAYVRANRKQRTFHIDSGSTVMHCKALTEGDFDRWTNALKTFIVRIEHEGSLADVANGVVGGVGGGGQQVYGDADGGLNSVRAAVDKMRGSIQDLEAVQAELLTKATTLHDPTGSHSGPSTPSPQAPSPHAHSTSPHAKFHFLKKSSNRRNTTNGGSSDDYFDARSSPSSTITASGAGVAVVPEHLVRQLGTALATLKSQHEALLLSLSSASSLSASHPHHNSHSHHSSFDSLPRGGNPTGTPLQEYYEPDDIPGEFFLDEEDEERGTGSAEEEEEGMGVEDEVDSFSSVEEVDEEEREEEKRARGKREQASEVTAKGRDTDVDVVRRTAMPFPTAGDEFSMLGMLRKNVGKDLSTISFPVTMNEPLSGLQRITEDFEYADLLHRAAASADPMERLALVATFAISGSSSNKYRSSRKPFNPLLGETYECIRPDKGFKFVSEKVSHHPPVLAFHTEGRGWHVDGYVAPSQKFWGRSMEIFMHGDYLLTFEDTNETFSIKRPSSYLRNLVAGTKYLEIVGDLIVTNESSGAKAVISFKEGSTWGGNSTRNKLEGKVFDANGTVQVELVGRWDEHVDRKEGKDSYQRLWRVNEFPPHAEKYYGFSTFAAQLNELTALEDSAIPASDSRLRPDQLALENGDVDLAEEEKKRVEEKQRMKRKDAEHPPHPIFFMPDGEGWKYGGEYFALREKHAFVDPDIF